MAYVLRVGCVVLCVVRGHVVFIILTQTADALDDGVREPASATHLEAYALHVLLDVEVLGRVGTVGGETYLEDSQVRQLHGFSLEGQLTDTAYHIGQYAGNGSLSEWGVVLRHVLSEPFKINGTCVHGTCVPLAETLTVFILVLILLVVNHNA